MSSIETKPLEVKRNESGYNAFEASYTIKAARWTWQALKTDHDNIVDSKLWAVARRVIATFVGSIGIVAGVLADAARGCFSREWIARNTGETFLNAVSKAFNWLQPTKNFYQSIAREIENGFRSAGEAVESGEPNETQPWNVLNQTFEKVAKDLALHFVCCASTDSEIQQGIEQLRQELSIETAARPHYYLSKNNTVHALLKVDHAIDEIKKLLPKAFVEPVAKACIVPSDGSFSDQKRTSKVETLSRAGVLPPEKVTEFTNAVDGLGSSLAQQEKAKIAVEAAKAKKSSPVATDVDISSLKLPVEEEIELTKIVDASTLRVPVVEEETQSTKVIDASSSEVSVTKEAEKEGKVTTADAKKAAKAKQALEKSRTVMSKNFDKANRLLEMIIEQQDLFDNKFNAIVKNSYEREALLADYQTKQKAIVEDLIQRNYTLSEIVAALTVNNEKPVTAIEKAVLPLKALRKEVLSDQNLRALHGEVTAICNKLKSLNAQMQKIKLPSAEEFKANATAEQKEKALKYNQLRNTLNKNNEITIHAYQQVKTIEAKVIAKVQAVLNQKPEFEKPLTVQGFVNISDLAIKPVEEPKKEEVPPVKQSNLNWFLKQVPLVNRVVA